MNWIERFVVVRALRWLKRRVVTLFDKLISKAVYDPNEAAEAQSHLIQTGLRNQDNGPPYKATVDRYSWKPEPEVRRRSGKTAHRGLEGG